MMAFIEIDEKARVTSQLLVLQVLLCKRCVTLGGAWASAPQLC